MRTYQVTLKNVKTGDTRTVDLQASSLHAATIGAYDLLRADEQIYSGRIL
jgi:hypothetical protein